VEHSVTRRQDRFGFWISTLTAVTTAITFVMAVLTPPKAGPFCTDDCLAYPYTDFAAYIPRDFVWMYPALLVAPLLVTLLATMHSGRRLPGGRSRAVRWRSVSWLRPR